MTVDTIKTVSEQLAIFKKNYSLLSSYISSIYDNIARPDIKSLNIFTSDPKEYKEAILSSLDNLDSRGSLFGLPIVVKDNINTKDFPTSAGTPALEGFTSSDDAKVIKKLKDAGAIIIGKTNMHELSFGITSNNAHFGPVKNPSNPSYFAGGSSGGTAAAVASGLVRVGLGTDTGGSCRIPAALCGVFGYRPTIGIYPSKGVIRLSSTRDTVGLLAKSMDEIILLDEVITDQSNDNEVEIKSIRIGIPRAYFYENLSKEVRRISDETIQKLKDKGIQLIETDIEGIPELLTEHSNIVLHETYVNLHKHLDTYAPEISYEKLVSKIASPDVKGFFNSGTINKKANYRNAINIERPNLQKKYASHFKNHKLDALLFPTTPVEARPISENNETIEVDGVSVPSFQAYTQNMNPGSYAGIPGVSIPAGETKQGLPVGMHIEGPKGSDKKLLKIAQIIHKLIVE